MHMYKLYVSMCASMYVSMYVTYDYECMYALVMEISV